jgi:chromosome segregation ATPase
MTDDEMERAIESLVQQSARTDARIDSLVEQSARTDARLDRLAESVQAMQSEMREGFENLIVANEVTRNLAEQVAKLAIETKRRVDNLESKAS